MKILVNALSTTNESGRQVLCGLLLEFLRQSPDQYRLCVLLHDGNRDIVDHMRSQLDAALRLRVSFHFAPGISRNWLGRACYERLYLQCRVKQVGADLCLSPSGGWVPGLSCLQYTLALNPWAMVATGPRGISGQVKAMLQRRVYRQALKHADGIGYGSIHMRGLYRANAGEKSEKCGAIVYPALPTNELAQMDEMWNEEVERDARQILCVSHMAAHKDIETLLLALQILRNEYKVPATLRLVGRWSDVRYRARMEELVEELGLVEAVAMDGFLSRSALLDAYRRARVYCLLSRSESFGIPSVEAQRMGTPVVAARGSAASEVCGTGGVYVAAGDSQGAAGLLCRLLTDESYWKKLSLAARQNALRFEYQKTVRPLLEMLGTHAEKL